jgi:flagellar hook-length control protein FliK
LPQELPLPAPLPTAAVAALQPDRTAQTISRGAQAGPALAATPQLADAVRAVSDAVQLAQPVPQQDIAVSAAAAQTRGDAALLAAPFGPARQDLFTTPGMTTLRTTATRAATASVAAGVVQGAEPLATAKPDLLATLAPQATFATVTPAPAPAATVAPPPPALQTLPMPVTDNAWGEALGERVAVLAGQKLTSVEIRLNPAELGPLRVEIKVDDGNAQVNFTALHAVTREAIEQALPRLRELLSAEGLNLTGANVSEQGLRRDAGGHEQSGGQQGTFAADESAVDAGNGNGVATAKPGKGLVDTFA